MPVKGPFPTTRLCAVKPRDPAARWLVEGLWGQQAAGIIGGAPKAAKSWLGLDLAVSVASGTPCLDRFEVNSPGPALVYLAEDHESCVRDRVEQLCARRGLSLDSLDIELLDVASLRLDLEEDCRRLESTIAALRPRLVLLDPLVRLHRADENSSSDVSRILGHLRELNRRYEVAVVIVHHMSKKARANLGQALRGSGDLHAWVDSACYLVHKQHGDLQLTVEHRAAPAPDPLRLRLVKDAPAHLEVAGADAEPPPLTQAVRNALLEAGAPLSKAALREQLRVNNNRLGETLAALERRGLVQRTPSGWTIPADPDSRQMSLPG